MFDKLFAESGLTLDRLKALLAVAAAGSISKAAAGDPVKQSQYSRQIKELEEFFRVKLVERQGKGIRLTANGRELTRISRFFMLGLSNFQRGCLTEDQTFRVGAGATVLQQLLLPVVSGATVISGHTRFVLEVVGDNEIEWRLHDLTLDFALICRPALSRPLLLRELGNWRLELWVPVALYREERGALRAFRERQLPLALAATELAGCGAETFLDHDIRLTCDSFLQARDALLGQQVAAVLPDYLPPAAGAKSLLRLRLPGMGSRLFHHCLAWNPRLLRLNPHATRSKDFLGRAIAAQMAARRA